MQSAASSDAPALDAPRLQRLLEVGRILVSELDLEAVLQRLLEEARELTGARYAALGVLAGDRSLERFMFTGIDEHERRGIAEFPQGRGVLGLLVDEPKPIRIDEVGAHPRSFGFPAGHPPMSSFLGVPIEIRGRAYGNLYLTEKRGGRFGADDEQAAIVLAEWAAIAIQNARLYTDSLGRSRELERAVARLEATTEIARAVGGETRLNRVLETIVKRARALVEASALVALLEDRGELVVAATAGAFEAGLEGRRLGSEGEFWRRTIEPGTPERISDLSSRVGLSTEELKIAPEAALIAPLSFRGRTLGALVAFDRLRSGPQFDDEDERLLVAFAASAATAVETAQSVAEDRLRESMRVAEQERGRWARELHDETLQGLGALRVLLASARRTGDPAALDSATQDALEQITSEIASLRALITELRPAALDELGLGAAIESLAAHQARSNGLEITLDVALAWERRSDRRRLGAELELAIYRLAQEALTNIAKHARAERVWLQVSQDDDSVLVVVRDDGVGFEPSHRREGFGLVGMRERVTLTGGTLAVTSSPGDGTELRARIPLRRRDPLGVVVERRAG